MPLNHCLVIWLIFCLLCVASQLPLKKKKKEVLVCHQWPLTFQYLLEAFGYESACYSYFLSSEQTSSERNTHWNFLQAMGNCFYYVSWIKYRLMLSLDMLNSKDMTSISYVVGKNVWANRKGQLWELKQSLGLKRAKSWDVEAELLSVMMKFYAL